MNKEQLATTGRWLLTIAGSYLVSRGYIKGDEWQNLSTAIITVVGSIMVIAPIVQGLISKTKRAQVVAVSQLPEIAAVVVKDTAPATSPVVVAAQSPDQPKIVTQSQVNA